MLSPFRLGRAAILAAILLLAAAAPAAAQAPAPAMAFRYDVFEQPRLIRSLIAQDIVALMSFRVGLVVENHGMPQGLALYLKAFNAEISQFFVCPVLMPAGLEAEMGRFIAGRTLDPAAQLGVAVEALRIFLGRRQGGNASFDPRAGMAAVLDGQTATDRITSQGQRDARLFATQTGCNGPEADALSDGVRALMRHLGAVR